MLFMGGTFVWDLANSFYIPHFDCSIKKFLEDGVRYSFLYTDLSSFLLIHLDNIKRYSDIDNIGNRCYSTFWHIVYTWFGFLLLISREREREQKTTPLPVSSHQWTTAGLRPFIVNINNKNLFYPFNLKHDRKH